MEATSIGRRRRPRNASEDRGLTDTEDESEDEQQGHEEAGSDEEGLDYLQLFAAAISALRTPRPTYPPLQISHLTNRTFAIPASLQETREKMMKEEQRKRRIIVMRRRR